MCQMIIVTFLCSALGAYAVGRVLFPASIVLEDRALYYASMTAPFGCV